MCLQLLADELEEKLGLCRDKGVDDDAVTRKATKVSAAAARLGAKGKTPGQSNVCHYCVDIIMLMRTYAFKQIND